SRGVKLAVLQPLRNYKSHHASAFGSHACNAMPHGTCSLTTGGGPPV
ncbi:unnamed protein product, partial [Staurois parvus]